MFIKDLVSVIVPTHNRAHMLEKAISSIRKQTYKNVEIIIVANGCKDNTTEVGSKLESKYENVKFLDFIEPLGGAEARNKGLDAVSGEYIAFLDDDDEWLENKLEMQVNILKKSQYCIVGCNYNIMYTNNKIRPIRAFKNEIKTNDMLYENILGSYSFCMTKNIYINEVRINPDLKSSQDWDLWLKILTKYNMDAYILDDILVNYYEHDEKITKNYKNKIKSEYIFIDYWYKYFDKNMLNYHKMRFDLIKLLSGEKKKYEYIVKLFKYLFIILKSPYKTNFLTYYIYIIRVFIK